MTTKKTTLDKDTPTEVEETEAPARYAVYDLTFLRFLTTTYADQKDAEAVAKTRDDLEVREV